MTLRISGVPITEIVILPSDRAHYCPQCRCVSNIPSVCPACGNELNVTLLSKWLDRGTDLKESHNAKEPDYR